MITDIKLPTKYELLSRNEKRLVREKYVEIQNGLCYHCKNPLTSGPSEIVAKAKINHRLYPQGFFKNPIHLHHDHVTGLTLGAVHCRCNAHLWEYHNE